jgi:hypothetical protein
MSTTAEQTTRPGAHRTVIAVGVALIAVYFAMTYLTFNEVGGAADLMKAIFATWWGRSFMVEQYIALSIIAGWIWAIEENKRTATLWIVALYLVGSLVAILYVIRRALRADSLRAIFVGAAPLAERPPRTQP